MPSHAARHATTGQLSFTADPHPHGVIAADSDDALIFLTPILGPTSTLLLHRLTRHLATATTDTIVWQTATLAATFGLGTAHDTNSRIVRSLARLERFGFLHGVHLPLHVMTVVPPLTQRHQQQLPHYLQALAPVVH